MDAASLGSRLPLGSRYMVGQYIDPQALSESSWNPVATESGQSPVATYGGPVIITNISHHQLPCPWKERG